MQSSNLEGGGGPLEKGKLVADSSSSLEGERPPSKNIEMDATHSHSESELEPSRMASRLYLDSVGEVDVLLTPDRISWLTTGNTNASSDCDMSSCWGLMAATQMPTEVLLSDIYAVELASGGSIFESKSAAATYSLLSCVSKLHCFAVHFVEKLHKQHSVWIPRALVFGHPDPKTCQEWVQRIHNFLNIDDKRPKKLLVFVNPLSGKKHAVKTWEVVRPLFDRAKIILKVVKTVRAGHAFDIMKEITTEQLNCYDGAVTVGGDGFFNEVVNGLLSWRHKAPYPPSPVDVEHCIQENAGQPIVPHTDAVQNTELGARAVQDIQDHADLDSPPLCYDKDSSPLLPNFVASRIEASHLSLHQRLPSGDDPISQGRSEDKSSKVNLMVESSRTSLRAQHEVPNPRSGCDNIQGSCTSGEATTMPSFLNPSFRIGIIPAGSTDTIVVSTTGARDPITSALQIILGKRLPLDIAQVVSWKSNSKSSGEAPCVRYLASFAGYGFYGDVIRESESYRWMGPTRYDFAGTRVFLRHRAYEAEVSFIEVPDETTHHIRSELASCRNEAVQNSKKMKCLMNCAVCANGIKPDDPIVFSSGVETLSQTKPQASKWLKSKGLFLSVGAALMSCRNDKAPDGVVADAHLADGFLHLVLIKDCSHVSYLRHLLRLTRKDADPLDFKFIEHHKTTAFTFVSHGEESMWNVDGEVFPACQLSAQVFRGLISLFATGPEL